MPREKARDPKDIVRRQPPVAQSSLFVLRMLPSEKKSTIQVAVPVRVEAKATARNRMKRQIAGMVREMLREHHANAHVSVMVRRGPLPVGRELREAIFVLLKESGMMKLQ